MTTEVNPSSDGGDSEDQSALLLPATSECVSWVAHRNSVNALALTPNGARMASGGLDGLLRLWDFHGMSRVVKPFREYAVTGSHAISSIQVSPAGSELLVSGGDAICRLIDLETGEKIQQTVQGDMYVRDMTQTKGHTHAVLDAKWHPTSACLFATASLDNTVRIFDLNAKAYGIDFALPQIAVLKSLDKRNSNISQECGLRTVEWAPETARFLLGGCDDGSVQCWQLPGAGAWRNAKPNFVIRSHCEGPAEPITALKVVGNTDEKIFTSRSASTLKVWDMRNRSKPLKTLFTDSRENVTGVADMHMNGRFIIAIHSTDKQTHKLKIYDSVNDYALTKSVELPAKAEIKSICSSVVLNQIILGRADGGITGLMDRTASTKGLTYITKETIISPTIAAVDGGASADTAARQIDLSTPVYSYYEMPENIKETRDGTLKLIRKRRSQLREEANPALTRASSKEPVLARTLAQSIMNRFLDEDRDATKRYREEDFVERMRSAAETEASSGQPASMVERAYRQTQPRQVLDYSDLREEEALLAAAKTCPKCGLKMCTCGYYRQQQSSDEALTKRAKFG